MRLFKKTQLLLCWFLLSAVLFGCVGRTGSGLPDSGSEIAESPEVPSLFEGLPTPDPTPDPVQEEEDAPPPFLLAAAAETAIVYRLPEEPVLSKESRSLGEILRADPNAVLPIGQPLEVFETDDPLWYRSTLSDGSEAYLYGESLFRITESGTPSGRSLFQEELETRIAGLKTRFPSGKYWNHVGIELDWDEESPDYVTDIPCSHARDGEMYCNCYNGRTAELFPGAPLNECLGFASYVSDSLFGAEAPIYEYRDLSRLRPGDHIRLREYEHSMIVLAVVEDGIIISEVNENYEDCLIRWGKKVFDRELWSLSWDIVCYSRYPLRPDGSGGFTLW